MGILVENRPVGHMQLLPPSPIPFAPGKIVSFTTYTSKMCGTGYGSALSKAWQFSVHPTDGLQGANPDRGALR